MTMWENFITVFVLGSLIIIGYLKYTNKSLVDFIKELRGAFSDNISSQGGLNT
jgi:hypothetical protein